jgi:beta-galactosidase
MTQDARPLRDVVAGFAYGGDYNPEQWDESVWVEDVALMREARVNLVTLGVFAWGSYETADGVYDFGWLDRVIDLLSDAGISIDLATPTAAPPIWLHRAHPEILPMDRRGIRYHQGGRLQWCPSSPVWRAYATRIAGVLAERYGAHPAVRMWHVSNELGGGNRLCYCDASAAHFRRWLEERYADVATLNDAWGTAFWGLRYGSFDEVIPPLDSESQQNPSLVLDFERFSSDALLEHYRAERDALRSAGVTAPITTNLMVGPGASVVDYAAWVPELDVIANDHYTTASDPRREVELAYAADRTRGLDVTRPWLVMEHSTSAVNWQVRNRAKLPGELVRNSMQHVARGADGALFFQWRASRSGAEQFHSAMVPHAGTRSKVWRDVVELGRVLDRVSEVAGSLVESARVAIVVDDVALWAWRVGQKPLNDLAIERLARAVGDSLYDRGVVADVVPSSSDLARYDVVIVPGLYLATPAVAQRVRAAAEAGATVLVTFLSGIVDETNSVVIGGYPGAFRDMLGVSVEEFLPLAAGETVALDGGEATEWTEWVHADDADVLSVYGSGPLSGRPAVTRRSVGEGRAYYLSTFPDAAFLDRLIGDLLGEAGVAPTVPAAPGLEAVRRVGDESSWLFLVNHSAEDVDVATAGVELISGDRVAGSLVVAAGGVAVVREDRV